MANKVVFEDYSVKVLNALQSKAENFLEESGGLVESKTKDLTRVQSGKTRRSWNHIVNKGDLTVNIGSPDENALWEERGTGEYALYGKGRKGGWWICEDQLDSKTRSLFENKYHFKKRKGKGGKVFYYTKGKKGTQALEIAMKNSQSSIVNRAKKIFREMNSK